eukprot:TRINITY_DN12418_c0_g1_i2.p1 TRINITY_DN12418_c0_g1~~TRINITY_DN12418_c0_g1_i2.p1  ORF type:complete len:263 (+),score=60.76 TRINITY_DN12418_c0_g1_i2:77-790(+)
MAANSPPPGGGGGGGGATPSSGSKGPPPSRKGFKLVLLGDASVGKSSILMRFLQNKFSDGIETTVGAAFSTKTIETRKRQIKFEIWDTAGQERFKSLAPMYYRGASAAVVVYDQTSEASFQRAQDWVKQVTATTSNPNIVIGLAANKLDLVDSVGRAVPLDTAEAFAEREGLLLMETSALSGRNVLRLFETVAEHLPDEPFVPEQRGLVVTASKAPETAGGSQQPEPQRGGCCGRGQ